MAACAALRSAELDDPNGDAASCVGNFDCIFALYSPPEDLRGDLDGLILGKAVRDGLVVAPQGDSGLSAALGEYYDSDPGELRAAGGALWTGVACRGNLAVWAMGLDTEISQVGSGAPRLDATSAAAIKAGVQTYADVYMAVQALDGGSVVSGGIAKCLADKASCRCGSASCAEHVALAAGKVVEFIDALLGSEPAQCRCVPGTGSDEPGCGAAALCNGEPDPASCQTEYGGNPSYCDDPNFKLDIRQDCPVMCGTCPNGTVVTASGSGSGSGSRSESPSQDTNDGVTTDPPEDDNNSNPDVFYVCAAACNETPGKASTTACAMAMVDECTEFPLNDLLPIDQYVTITSGHKLHWLPSRTGDKYTIRMYDDPSCLDSSINTVISDSLREDETYGAIIKRLSLKEITLQMAVTGTMGSCLTADFSGTTPSLVGTLLSTSGPDFRVMFSDHAVPVGTTGTAPTPGEDSEKWGTGGATTTRPTTQDPREQGGTTKSTKQDRGGQSTTRPITQGIGLHGHQGGTTASTKQDSGGDGWRPTSDRPRATTTGPATTILTSGGSGGDGDSDRSRDTSTGGDDDGIDAVTTAVVVVVIIVLIVLAAGVAMIIYVRQQRNTALAAGGEGARYMAESMNNPAYEAPAHGAVPITASVSGRTAAPSLGLQTETEASTEC